MAINSSRLSCCLLMSVVRDVKERKVRPATCYIPFRGPTTERNARAWTQPDTMVLPPRSFSRHYDCAFGYEKYPSHRLTTSNLFPRAPQTLWEPRRLPYLMNASLGYKVTAGQRQGVSVAKHQKRLDFALRIQMLLPLQDGRSGTRFYWRWCRTVEI
jgi:hypothetical protein